MKKWKLDLNATKVKAAFSRILPKSKPQPNNSPPDKPKKKLTAEIKLPNLKKLRIKFVKFIAYTKIGKTMTNWKIGGKILFGYLLILFSLFFVGGYCLFSLHNLSNQYEQVLAKNIPAIQAVHGLEAGVVALDNSIKTYMLTNNPQAVEEFNKQLEDMVYWIGESRNYALTPEEKKFAEGLRRDYEEYQGTIGYALSKLQSGDQAGALEIMGTAVEEAKTKLLGNNETLIKSNEQAMEKAALKVQQIRQLTLIIILLLFLFSIIIGIFMGIYLPVSIVKPINDLVASSKKVAQGDLTSTIQVFSSDEIGELGTVFNQMIHNLKSLLQEVKYNADQVAFSSEQLETITDETSKSATQISVSIQEIADGSEDADQAVDNVSSTITQMSAGIQQIASNAQMVTTVSKQASDYAKLGNEDLHNAIKQINSLSNTVNKSAAVIKILGEHSKAIGQITGVITNIADQTNLLSLNASIEAARAGESGRGFAVVAQEVKKLADQSAKYAKEITLLIKEIQIQTNQAVEAMEAGTKEALQAMQVMEHADKSFKGILDAVEDVTRQIEDVSNSAEEMAQSTHQVVDAITKISQITEQVSGSTQNIAAATEEQTAAMEQIAGAAECLNQMAEGLKEQVSKFKID